MNWKRSLAYSALILLASMTVAIASGLAMAWMPLETEAQGLESVQQMRVYRRIGIFLVATIGYWWLLRPLSQRWQHGLLAFVLVQVLDLLTSWPLFGWPEELIDIGVLGRGLLALGAGLLLATRFPARTTAVVGTTETVRH